MAVQSKRRSAREISRDVARGKYILNPEFNETEAEKKEKRDHFWIHPFHTHKDFENEFPEDFGKTLGPKGKWIQIKDPPPCEITVPPFSIWFAVPWPGMNAGRVKIVTPVGSLGVMPCEFHVIDDVTKFFGMEKDGVLLHQLTDRPVCNTDHLFYLMSRGITRKDATIMLANDIKDPSFMWMEFAPPYGEYFGREWPSPERCSFCTPAKDWIQTDSILVKS